MKTVKLNTECKMNPTIFGEPHCSFSFVDRISKNEFEQVGGWEICRELLCSTVLASVMNKDLYMSSRTKAKVRGMDRTRVAVLFLSPKRVESKRKRDRRVVLAWMKRSLALLNFCEKIGGLKRSRLYKANMEEVGKRRHYFIFESSYEWMGSMPLLSLYLLILRAGRFKEFSGSFESMNDLQAALENLSKEFNKIKRSSLISNKPYRGGWPFSGLVNERAKMRAKIFILSRLEILMRERKNIFSTMEENYKETKEMQHGIAGLTGYGGSTFPKDSMKEKYKEARKKYKFKNLLA